MDPNEVKGFLLEQQMDDIDQVKEENRIKGIEFLLEFEYNDPNESINQREPRDENDLEARA